jgi:hypothetical protein
MKLIGIGETKDEQDIIEPWVRHNMLLLDHLIVMDGSNDDTYNILEKLAEEFKDRIDIQKQKEFGDFQSSRTTALLREAYHLGADFIFPLDADEFLGVPNRLTLEGQLQKIPIGGAGNLPWRTFIVTPDTIDTCANDAPKGFKYRRAVENPLHYKVIVRTEGLNINQVWIGTGNHDCSSVLGSVKTVNLDVPLLHFPLRSQDQMIGKAVLRWVGTLSANPSIRTSGGAWHIRDIFDKLLANGQLDLCNLSLLYAQHENQVPTLVEEIPIIQYERKYSSGRAMNAVSLIAKSWEKTLEKVGG